VYGRRTETGVLLMMRNTNNAKKEILPMQLALPECPLSFTLMPALVPVK